MEIDRRRLLALFGATLAMPRTALADAAGDPMFLAARTRQERHEIVVIDRDGVDRLSIPVDARGHSFAIDTPRRRAVAFDRAPGVHAVFFDIEGKAAPTPLVAKEGRHFFGHGIFSDDGRLLLASENDYEGGRGIVGVYDVGDDCRRVGEFDSAGIGPHDVVPLPDGKTLCVANGGILTHPDYDGIKLNLDSMAPSLSYLDVTTGDLIEQAKLPPDYHQLSIRHLVVDAFGTVWFGCQYQGDPADRPPLVGRHRRGREPELFAGPPETLRALDNYVGSVSTDLSGEIVATSSPLGGLVTFWDAATGRNLGRTELADGCGIAPLDRGRLLASSGRGVVAEIEIASGRETILAEMAQTGWDNHMRRLD